MKIDPKPRFLPGGRRYISQELLSALAPLERKVADALVLLGDIVVVPSWEETRS